MPESAEPSPARPIGLLRPVPAWATAIALTGLLVALAAAVSPFHRCVPRRQANESAAIATLKNIHSAQGQLQVRCAIDVDGDGRGEFGFLAELAAAVPLRVAEQAGRGVRLDPPLLSSGFRKVERGVVQRSGYVFCCFLRCYDGAWFGEGDAGGADGLVVDADSAERDWRVLAWPAVPGSSGTRTFAVDATGVVRATAPDRPVFGGTEAPGADVLDDPTIDWRTVQ